jgi:hypothetical protein
MPATTSRNPGRAVANGGVDFRIVEDSRPVLASQQRFPYPRPAIARPSLPISHPIPSPSSSRPVSHPPSSLLPQQTPLHRGCAGLSSPVEADGR